MVLKECPAYEDCLLWHRTHGCDKEFFRCDGCTSYKCYELGFMQGAKEAVEKMNECEPILVNTKEQHYRNLLSWYRKKLKGE